MQDADRLEALRAMASRVLPFRGAGRALDAHDPFADARPDDRAFALDHFQTKLLRHADTMQTEMGRELYATAPIFSSSLCKRKLVPEYRVTAWAG